MAPSLPLCSLRKQPRLSAHVAMPRQQGKAQLAPGLRAEGQLLDSPAVVLALWQHLDVRSKRALRLCSMQLRAAVDDVVVALVAPHPTLHHDDAHHALAKRWPNAQFVSLRLSGDEARPEQALLDAVNAMRKLRQLSVHLAPHAPLAYLTDRLTPHALSSVTRLHLPHAPHLTDLSPLSHLTNLLSLTLTAAPLTHLHPLPALCPRLQHLSLTRCRHLLCIDALALLAPSLRNLSLAGCTALRSVTALAACTLLHTLDLTACAAAVSSPSSTASAASLASLGGGGGRVSGRPAPAPGTYRHSTAAAVAGPAPHAQHLPTGPAAGHRTPARTDVPVQLAALSPLVHLRTLNLSRCPGLHDLSVCRHLPSLERLSVARCPSLTDLSPLSACTSLTALDTSCCHALATLAPLGVPLLRNLLHLRASFCWALPDLSPLSACARLATLDVSGCPLVSTLAPLAACTSLEQLDASLCQGVSDVSPLGGAKALKRLDVGGTAVRAGDEGLARVLAACPALVVAGAARGAGEAGVVGQAGEGGGAGDEEDDASDDEEEEEEEGWVDGMVAGLPTGPRWEVWGAGA